MGEFHTTFLTNFQLHCVGFKKVTTRTIQARSWSLPPLGQQAAVYSLIPFLLQLRDGALRGARDPLHVVIKCVNSVSSCGPGHSS